MNKILRFLDRIEIIKIKRDMVDYCRRRKLVLKDQLSKRFYNKISKIVF